MSREGVVLGKDYWEWERNLIHRWRDLINPTQETDFVIVSPTPPTASTPTEVHIILYQQLGAFNCPSLVTTYDNGVLRGAPYTAAILLPAAASRDEIIAHAGKTFVCPPYMPTTSCTCWYEGIELHPMRLFQLDTHLCSLSIASLEMTSGLTPQLKTSRKMRQQLQASYRYRPTASTLKDRLDAEPRRSGAQYVNLQHSIKEFEVFDSHFFMPDLDLGDWALALCLSLDTGLVGFATPGHTLWIYYDGSYIAHEASATAAAAAFLQVDDHWQFAGSDFYQGHSYDAEHLHQQLALSWPMTSSSSMKLLEPALQRSIFASTPSL